MQTSIRISASVAKPLLSLKRTRQCVVKAAAEGGDKPQNSIFYAGNAYTEDEWASASSSGAFKPAPPSEPVIASTAAPTVNSLMAFDGPAPELVNGRLAMLGFVAALGAELSSGESVFSQIGEQPAAVMLTFLTIAIATLIPLSVNSSPESRNFGPFNAPAEMTNGRAAMLGIVALLVGELIKGGAALFSQ